MILWPDTFTDHFRPTTAWAAVDVLESAGYRVFIPPRPLCCGRPLYDFGMLKLARHQLRQILRTLAPAISRGIPMVGIEPSCTAVFRDELVNVLPDDEDAKRLSGQTFFLSELLAKHTDGWEPPRISGRAIVQAHCHHRATMDFGADEEVLRRTGLDVEVLDSGCCGMAGAFGFEAEHYDVSMACGERVLLPAVRGAGPDVAIVADGFSCREQIEQATDRRTLHTAEVLAGAIRASVADARADRAAADTRVEGGDR